MSLKLITPPAIEPVNPEEAKIRLRIDGTDDDSFLSMLISTARQSAEKFCRRVFINQTWDLTLNSNEVSDPLEVLKPPLQSITSITYIDTAGVTQAFSSSNYWVDTNSEPGRILLKPGGSWPSGMRDYASFIIRYIAGYGANPDDVPGAIREAMLRMVTTLYERREDVIVGTIVAEVPMDAQALLMPYKVMYL